MTACQTSVCLDLEFSRSHPSTLRYAHQLHAQCGPARSSRTSRPLSHVCSPSLEGHDDLTSSSPVLTMQSSCSIGKDQRLFSSSAKHCVRRSANPPWTDRRSVHSRRSGQQPPFAGSAAPASGGRGLGWGGEPPRRLADGAFVRTDADYGAMGFNAAALPAKGPGNMETSVRKSRMLKTLFPVY